MRIAIVLILLLIFSCQQTQSDTDSEQKSYLKSVFEDYQNKGFKHKNPSMVVNGYLMKPTEGVYWRQMKVKACEIELIHFMNDTTANNIYGAVGKNGIVLITSGECVKDRSPKITM
ncbi:MAG: hypothetical protein AAFQ94_03040 [Bacteroidota bacterium]